MAELLDGDESKKTKFSKYALKDLGEALESIEEMYSEAMQILKTGDLEDAKKISKKKEKMLDLDINMRKAHMDRVAKGICEAKMTSEHNRVLHIVDRMSNSCANIAEGALGQIDFKYFANIELSDI